MPCFGLTGPNNGSDAVGSIDRGQVVKQGGKLFIKIKVNKRYITLAPIANIAGIAFNLEDPDGLLESGKSGITVALVEKGTCGLRQETHHNPLNVGFPNGTLKGDLLIPIEQVIGGVDNVGEGVEDAYGVFSGWTWGVSSSYRKCLCEGIDCWNVALHQ